MKEAGAASDEADSKIGGLVATAGKAGLALGVAAIGIGVASVKMASDFQASMEKLSTLAGVPQSAISGLSSSVLDLAGKVGFAPDSLAEALYHVESSFASTGITSAQAMKILQTAAEGARIGGANLTDVTNALDAAVVSGIPGVQNMNDAMGGLLATVGGGDMTMQDFADAASTGILATAKVYGNSLTDVGAALATFGDNNIRGQTAATDLKMAIMDLTKQSSSGEAALAKIGIQAGQLGTDMQTGGLNKAMTDLHDHLVAAGDDGSKMGQVLEDAFTKKSSAPMAVLLSQFDRLQSKYADITKGEGGFTSAWAKTQDTLKQQWAEIESGAKAVGIKLGIWLTPKVEDMIGGIKSLGSKLKGPLSDIMSGLSTGDTTTSSGLANAAGGIRDLFATIAQGKGAVQDTSSGIAKLGGIIHDDLLAGFNSAKEIFSGVVDGLQNLWKVIQPLTPAVGAYLELLGKWWGVLGKIGPAIRDITGFLAQHKTIVDAIVVSVGAAVAVWEVWKLGIAAWKIVTEAATAVEAAFDAVMDANPIMLVVGAIAGLAAGLIYAYTHSKTFRDIVNDIGGALKKVWTDVLLPVVNFFENHWKPILIAAGLVLAPFITIPILIYKYWGDITGFFSGLWGDVESIFTNIIGTIVSTVESWAGKVWTALVYWVELPKHIYDFVVGQGGLIGIGTKIMNALTGAFKAAFPPVLAFFDAIPGEILKALTGAVQWLAKIGMDVITGLWNGITTQVVQVWNFFTALPGQIVKAIGAMGSTLYGAGKDLLTGLLNGVDAGATDLWHWLWQLPSRILNWAGDAGSWLVNVGEDIVRGLIQGVGNMASLAVNAVKNVGSSIVSGVKHFLGIGSPSKVFADEVGRWIPPGIAAGIDAYANEAHASMSKLAGGLTATGRAGIGATGTVGGISGIAASAALAGGSGGPQAVVNNYNVYASDSALLDYAGIYKLMQTATQQHNGRNSSNGLAPFRAA